MQPVIGNGFGNFGHVLGPWSDFFPSSGGQGLPTSQFGVALGTTIQAGGKGATITSITVEPPFNIAGSSVTILYRVTVVKGPVPASLSRIGNSWQHAQNGYPSIGDQDQDATVLWSKIIGSSSSPNGGSASSAQPVVFAFPDLSGPSCGPGELMTVFITPLFNETGVPGFGAGNSTFMSLTVSGVMERRAPASGDADQSQRSMPTRAMG